MATSLKTPFRISNGRVAVTNDQTAQIRQKIVDALVTNTYERTQRPEYGGNLQAAAFEPIDTLEQADFKLDLATKISQYVTGVSVIDVNWDQIDDGYATINVVYQLPLSSQEQFSFRLAIPGDLDEETPLQ